ncbi:MAG: hypothetical protein K6357_06610 [Elusimicrobiota bacterium]
MFYIFLFVFIILCAVAYSGIESFSKKNKAELNEPYREKLGIELDDLYKLYSTGFIPIFVIHLILYLAVFFLKKSFLTYFIYGNLLSFLFVFFDVALNYYLSFIFYPFIISSQKSEEIKEIFLISKLVLYIILNYFFYGLFKRFFNTVDYGIIFSGIVFSSFVFYLYGSLRFKKVAYPLNLSYFSLILLSSVLIFMKWGSLRDVSAIVLLFFAFAVSKVAGCVFKNFVKIKYENIKEVFIFIVLYFLLSLVIFIKNYNNMFIFLSHFISFIVFYVALKIEADGFYRVVIMFILAVIFKFISKVFFVFAIDFTYERYSMFILSSCLPLLFLALKTEEVNWFFDFNKNLLNKNGEYNTDVSVLKIPIMAIFLIFYFSFSQTYNSMKIYYGYSDNFDIFVLFFPLIAFYFFETFAETILNKIETLALNLVYNISVIVFAFSFMIVSISYTSSLGFSNLFSVFALFLLLVCFFSKKYYQYIISLLYLVSFYVIVYV